MQSGYLIIYLEYNAESFCIYRIGYFNQIRAMLIFLEKKIVRNLKKKE